MLTAGIIFFLRSLSARVTRGVISYREAAFSSPPICRCSNGIGEEWGEDLALEGTSFFFDALSSGRADASERLRAMPFEGTTPVKKKKKAKKVKSSGSEVEHTPAQTELLALMAKLCACEQVCRQRYRAISGYTRERTTSESVSFGDLMQELSGLEQTVAAALGSLDETEVAGVGSCLSQRLRPAIERAVTSTM